MSWEWHPEPISTSVRVPRPSSSRTARHRLPSAFRVKVTPGAGLTLLLPSSLRTSSAEWLDLPDLPEVPDGLDRLPARAALPIADGDSELPVDGPAIVADPAGVVPAAVPPVERDDWAAGGAAGAELSPVAFDVWVTEVVPAVNGAVVVLVVSDGFTAADPLVFVGTVVVVALIC